jgi:hypothetical protein
MKILISIGSLGLGGAEKQAVWLANKLSKEHEVTLLTYHGGAREKDISSGVTWKTIFDNQSEQKTMVPDSVEFVTENPILALEVGSNDKHDLNHKILNELYLETPRSRTFKEKIKHAVKSVPALLTLLTQLYVRFELFFKLLRMIVITLRKVEQKSKQLFIRIARTLIKLVFFLVWVICEILLLLAL